jgi:peptidoglycan/LPS O-acetylase OafA/YrhL
VIGSERDRTERNESSAVISQPDMAANASRFGWLDIVKAVALGWVFLNHVSEQLFGYPYAANPDAHWPPLTDRVAQLAPLTGHGPIDILWNALRYIGWSGDQGVQIFLIVSGFGLTWGLLARGVSGPLPLLQFYRRRGARIYPIWWAVHLFALPVLVLAGRVQLGDVRFILSFLGVRFTTGTLYYLSPVWWYVGVLVQLYLVFPLLWELLRRYGPLRLFVVGTAFAVTVRGIGIFYFQEYLDPWCRGAIFVTRLPEFLVGMCTAAWAFKNPARAETLLRSTSIIIPAVLVYGVGLVLSLTLAGMSIAPLMLGAGAFVVLARASIAADSRLPGVKAPVRWIGQHSYSLFLLHGFFVKAFVPLGRYDSAGRVVVGMAACIVASIFAGIAVELITHWIVRISSDLATRTKKQ